jgi:uncharacterized protein (TIGR02466 family)
MTINALWPTLIYTDIVKEHNRIYEKFLPYIENKGNFDNTWTLGSSWSSIRKDSNDAMPWNTFFDAIKSHVDEFMTALGPTENYNLSCDEFWANVYFKGSYQEVHDHAFTGRPLSAIYILEIDEKQTGGELVFDYSNYNIIKYSGLNTFKEYSMQHFIPKLEPGMLIIFPSWLNHYVLPLTSDTRRVTLAANFKIE